MNFSRSKLIRAVCLGLFLITAACYSPIVRHEFINVDDPQYISGNVHVTTGLTRENIKWAFRSGYAANWHPLTWISHMADCQLYGLTPAGHHLTNLLLHSANTVLVFLVLLFATGRLWPSAFVAALFGWHPLHVESVAWAAERKDVLSTLFWLLTMLAYLRYVRASAIPDDRSEQAGAVKSTRTLSLQTRWYLLALVLFVCGLMSKPMVVTLPFVLLLVDFWPLSRLQIANLRQTWTANFHLVVEKLPFFALSIASSVITFIVQDRGGATSSLDNIPLHLRVVNSVIAYGSYVGKTFFPVKLTVLYPYADHPLISQFVASSMFLTGATVICLLFAKRYPFLTSGWLWFLGTLVPVIGLVQVGSQAMADRYMYIPSIGFFLAVVWGALACWERWNRNKIVLVAIGWALLLICVGLTSVQLHYWKNSVILARHGVEVLPNSYLAYNALTKALDDNGNYEEALAACLKSIELQPNYAEGQYNLGALLARKGNIPEAALHYELAVKHDPKCENAAHGLGNSYFKLGRLDEAIVQLSNAVRLKPEFADVRSDLGTVLLAQHKIELAIREFSEAIRLNPSQIEAQRNLGVALAGQGKIAEALPHLKKAAELAPTNSDLRFNYSLALLDAGMYSLAETQLTDGLLRFPDDPRFHYRMAVAQTKLHKPEKAIQEYREALRLSPDSVEAKTELSNLLATASDSNLTSRPESGAVTQKSTRVAQP